jgi:dihydroxyacetone kinase DhaKLM complex PTS-EIIA-like component DhaM
MIGKIDYNCFKCMGTDTGCVGYINNKKIDECIYKKIAEMDLIIYHDTGNINGSEFNKTTLTDMLKDYLIKCDR